MNHRYAAITRHSSSLRILEHLLAPVDPTVQLQTAYVSTSESMRIITAGYPFAAKVCARDKVSSIRESRILADVRSSDRSPDWIFPHRVYLMSSLTVYTMTKRSHSEIKLIAGKREILLLLGALLHLPVPGIIITKRSVPPIRTKTDKTCTDDNFLLPP